MKEKVRLPGLDKLMRQFGKFKYAIVIALLGCILLLWPKAETEVPEVSQSPPEQSVRDGLEVRLEDAIGEISGAGRTKLVLSWADDGQVVYQTDSVSSDTGDSRSEESSTVTLQSGSSRYEALIVQNRSPTCLGALVVCEGADSAMVRLLIVDAVSSVTGLDSNQISVVKMKN